MFLVTNLYPYNAHSRVINYSPGFIVNNGQSLIFLPSSPTKRFLPAFLYFHLFGTWFSFKAVTRNMLRILWNSFLHEAKFPAIIGQSKRQRGSEREREIKI